MLLPASSLPFSSNLALNSLCLSTQHLFAEDLLRTDTIQFSRAATVNTEGRRPSLPSPGRDLQDPPVLNAERLFQ